MSENAIPLTIITGFLGSGKTTLINNLLNELILMNKKVAIINNEFSDTGVENSVLKGSDGTIFTNIIELANGCICCTVKDNFVVAIEQLANEKKYDYILLECSGMVDPGPLIGMFWIDDQLQSNIYLDGVISICDSKYLLKQLKYNIKINNKTKQILNQIAYADKILLNKKDLIKDNNHLNDLMYQIKNINNIANIFVTKYSKLTDFNQILYIRAFDIYKPPNFDKLLNQNNSNNDHLSSQSLQMIDDLIHIFDANKVECIHDNDITSLIFEENRCVSIDKMEEWLSELLWNDNYVEQTDDMNENNDEKMDISHDEHEHKMEIFRMKGILPLKNGENHYLQCVQELFEIETGSSKWDITPTCKVVIIGKNLDTIDLKKGFNSIFIE